MSDLPSRPRILLRQLHRVMAGPGRAEERLQGVVRLIAQNMVAEVCSVYLVRAGEILELFATEGLNPQAVHQTRLRFGEGLVGLVAQRGMPLRIQEAPKHPRFAYRAETGEEPYHSFLGVPIIRHGKVIGVLVVQNVKPREYTDEEEETLQTIAMVLAELIGSGELVAPEEIAEVAGPAGLPLTLDGEAMAAGLAAGRAVLHEGAIEVTRYVAEDVEQERERLNEALAALREEIDRMLARPEMGAGGEHREVLEAYRMFAQDRGWRDRILHAIDSGLTAEAAVERVAQDNRRRMSDTEDPYLRARLHDLEDISRRLLRVLAGQPRAPRLEEDSILMARNLGPAELLDYDLTRLKGVVLEEGAPTAHVAILARAMGIPLVGRVEGAREHVEPGDLVIVDAENAHVLVRPAEEVRETYERAIAARARELESFFAERDLPSITRDGVEITLMMNAGLVNDTALLERTGAAGIGLFRTEFQFMVRSTLPRLDAQRELYARVLETAGERPVYFRTLDIGGDKVVPFLPHDREANPAMGWRAIRIALDRPVLLRYQLRALMQASPGRALRVMFPMVATVAEFRAARAIVEKEQRRFERLGIAGPERVEVGVMVEVPSLAFELHELLHEADFLSVGTNDLVQFLFAVDRTNPKLTRRYDPLSPALLRFIRRLVVTADEVGVPLTVCGEMAGRPLDALALLALGVRRLSMSPSAIGPARRMVRSVDLPRVENFILQLIDSGEHEMRSTLRNFARDHGIAIGSGADFI